MAEKVHKRLELMLPELEELESTGVFSREEIRAIVQRRRSLEYRLLRRPSQKEDFLGAIQYEINLELLCRHRGKARGVISSRNDSSYGIQSRIHSLFRRALSKFKGDLKMWLQYIEFCKHCHHDNTLSKLYGQVLSIHPGNSSLWVMAAKFEFESMKNTSSARALLQQGIRANPESKHLWMELFRMELLYVEKMKKRRDLLGLEEPMDEKTGNMSDDFLAYKTVSVVYRQAVKAVPADIEFRLQFLPICQLFEGTEHRQQEIYDNLREDFFTHPLYWDALARRPWARQKAGQDSDVIKLEALSEAAYEEGIKATQNGDDLALLWDRYSRWALERVKCLTHSMELQAGATSRLLRVFRRALDTGCVTEDMFSCYIGTLLGLGMSEEAVQTGSKATDLYPKSVPMWLLRLQTLNAVGGDLSMEAMMVVYEKAIHAVAKEEALPIWSEWIQRSIVLCTTQDNIEHIFQAALACGVPAIREELCVKYVDWVFISRGIKQARKTYKCLMETPPVSYALYLKCITIETAGHVKVDLTLASLRELFEKALRDYGADHPDLWLKYMKVEMSHREGEPGNVGKLHWRAMKSLKPELTAAFIAQYSQLS